ncbi:MAG: hypothetical protein M3P18_09450 [Actinomycetota bacterium]|nr:hypothetical protein [Actinomycetota bacterium]
MARTNLHELANRLLTGLDEASADSTFQGKMRDVSMNAGLNSVRSAEAIKILEESGRIEVMQRGRRGRDSIIAIRSTEPLTLADAKVALPARKRAPKLNYEDLGKEVVDRLLALARDDGLRAAQVEVFAGEAEVHRQKVHELEGTIEDSARRETDLRIRLKAAEEALERAEENLRRAFGSQRPPRAQPAAVEDDDARALLNVLRSGRL